MSPSDATALLQRLTQGDADARERLFLGVYDALKDLARRALRDERNDHSLQPTALVHEVYLRLLGEAPVDAESRDHFIGLAARAVRQILCDHARRRGAQKRGGRLNRLTLTSLVDDPTPWALDLLDLEEALEKLARIDPLLARVVELRFFGGLTIQQTSRSLAIPDWETKRKWQTARAWLSRELRSEPEA